MPFDDVSVVSFEGVSVVGVSFEGVSVVGVSFEGVCCGCVL